MKFQITTCFLLLYSVTVYNQHIKDRPLTYEDDLDIQLISHNDSTHYVVTNKIQAPIELIVSDRETEREIKTQLLPALERVTLLKVFGNDIDSVRPYLKKQYKISYFIGHPAAISVDTNYRYRLPFKKGKKYEVSQGWNGKSSHQRDESRYAIDFQLEIGEPVYAAREGLVIKAIDWFTKRGGLDFRNKANRIVILHDDGTLASYVHLDYQGVLVSEGERVQKGQKIGFSGLTGFTRGPHLHFVVRKERDIAIPVYFEGYGETVLKQGRRYKIKP